MKWLRLFRVVNLPTVPGDVLAGAAAVLYSGGAGEASGMPGAASACAASVFVYMYGLADNDVVGAATDSGRPISDGAISECAGRVAGYVCLALAVLCGAAARLPALWWLLATALAVICTVYNRTKLPALMGLCRGLNVMCGGAAVAGWAANLDPRLLALAFVWTVYIGCVTKYSEGEEHDEAKKRRVGMLIGGIVYLQLVALLIFPVKPFLIAGAVLLVLLRLMRRTLPGVSAS